MSTNGKGSKRRPETKPGNFIKNWEEINWSKNSETPDKIPMLPRFMLPRKEKSSGGSPQSP